MADIRIRAIAKNGASAWVYIQQKTKDAPKKQTIKMNAAALTAIKGRTNQYGRFRYSNLQYGKIEAAYGSSISFLKTPTRIRNAEGEWIYSEKVEIRGACPAIRIRNSGNEKGPWVYIQHQEV